MKKPLLFIFLLLTSTITFSQIPNYVPTNGLVGWWPFNGNVNDISKNVKLEYRIYNQMGQTIMNGIADLTNNEASIIDVSSFDSGIYCINLKNNNYNLNYKLIKN